MSYENVQTGLSDTIKRLSSYTDSNVTTADYRLLNRGVTKAVVLRPGPFTQERTEFGGGIEATWNIMVELFVKYQDDTQVQNAIRDERQDIIDKVNEYPLLGGSAIHAMIIEGAEPTPVFGENGSGPHYFMQEMTVAATEYLTVSEAE